MILISWVYVICTYILMQILDISSIVTFIILTAIYFLGIYAYEYYSSASINEESLKEKIIEKLNSEGFKCEKDEGSVVFQMKGRRYRTCLWETNHNNFRTSILDYLEIDENWDKISFEGKAVLANYVNRECYHTTFHCNDEGVICQYTTYIKNAKDFLDETKNAYILIDKAINVANDVLPQIKAHYTTGGKSSPIGFINKEAQE